VVAVLEFFSKKVERATREVTDVMLHVGTQLSQVVERGRLQRELIDAVWDQQRRFGQDLHDSLGQELTGIGMLANSLARRVSETDAAAGTVKELQAMIRQAKSTVRRLAKGLFPVEVDAEGLRAALEELASTTAERCQVAADFVGPRDVRVPDNEVATNLFRIAQEAVTNAVNHAGPSRIEISLENRGSQLVLGVSDDGCGLPPDHAGATGMGLRIMRYRAASIEAPLTITGRDGGGTCITCTLDRENGHAAE
jgi:two-component system CheB/CheR fusion protein